MGHILNNSTWRRSVILFIVGTIVAGAILQPFGSFAMRLLFGNSGRLARNYVDGLYENAALGQRDWVIALVYLIGTGVIVGAPVVLIVLHWVHIKVNLDDKDTTDANFAFRCAKLSIQGATPKSCSELSSFLVGSRYFQPLLVS